MKTARTTRIKNFTTIRLINVQLVSVRTIQEMTTIVRTKIREEVLIKKPDNKKTSTREDRIGVVEEPEKHTITAVKKTIYQTWDTT